MIRITTFAGRKVAVFGLGASGIATARALIEGGAHVVASDDSAESRAAADAAGIPTADFREANWSTFAALVVAPGVPLTHPEPHWAVRAAKLAGAEVIGDLELFVRERRVQAFEVPFIAITGTNGKSTTTALVGHLLRSAGRDVEVGGNIGTAMLSLAPFAPGRHYVIECSSYQIDLAPSLDPTVGVLLNITPDHLDRHGTIENYAAVKARLVKGARIAVVSVDDPYCRTIAASFSAHKQQMVTPVTVEHKLWDMSAAERLRRLGLPATFENCWLVFEYGQHFICHTLHGEWFQVIGILDNAALRGKHNKQNAAMACVAVDPFIQDKVAVTNGLSSFPGLVHRMEEIGRQGHVLFVNDSKATNADSAEKALLSFAGDIYWILGGKPKAGGIASLEPLFPRVARAYLIGEATEEFAATLEGKVPYECCGTVDAAVSAAARDAQASAAQEPVVLLSPACASFDQYRNFEVRGDAFRKAVMALPGITLKERAA